LLPSASRKTPHRCGVFLIDRSTGKVVWPMLAMTRLAMTRLAMTRLLDQ